MGGRFKLLENFAENLMFMPQIFENADGFNDIGQSMELEFDPSDPHVFYFSTTTDLYRCDRRGTLVPQRLATDGLGAPTALSMSDEGFLLVGFACGSIAIFSKQYSSPITIWFNACALPIVRVSWSSVFNNGVDENGNSSSSATKNSIMSKFMNRLCEFFVIDTSETFYIWNLSQNLEKSAHSIKFGQKHESLGKMDLNTISMTSSDQTFYTGFASSDFSVKLYAMNFRKGSTITKK